MTVKRLSATARRGALLLAVLAVSGWAIPTAPVGASRLPMGHAGLGAGHRANERRGLSLSQLPSSLANTIRHTLARQQRDDYRVLAQRNRFLAANPGQNMQIAFTPAGPRLSGRGWTWGMRLVGMGRSRINPVATGTMILQGSQLAYRRGHLIEWYRNGPTGLEQGFTLRARPAGPAAEAITLKLALSGSLQAHPERGGQELGLSLSNGQRVLRYGGLAAHDAVGRTLPTHLELTGHRLRLVVQDRGARYPVQIDPYAYQTQLDLGTSAASDNLGTSVALSSDGNTALLGAPGRPVNGQGAAGAGDVFTRSGATWSYQAQLDLDTRAPGADYLGYSTALSSDGNTALLGTFGRTVNGQTYAGAGEVFTRSGTIWSYQAQLDLGTNAAASDRLGTSVALSSDGNTALLGARLRTVNTQSSAGAGEIFTRSGQGWSYQTQLDLGGRAAGADDLGISAALSSDGNTALLGARYRTVNTLSSAGAAEVFIRSGALWSYQTQLDLSSSAATNDQLGTSVALRSDGATALLGAPYRMGNGLSNAGAGEVFSQGLSQTGVSNGTQASASVGGTGPNTPGSYSATASGASGSVTVATYSGNPTTATPPSNASGYFDVKVTPGNAFTSVSIVDCNLGIGTGLYWFDGTAWQAASPVSRNTPTTGCATLTVTGSSHPALSQLGGTPFVAGTAAPTAARVSAAHATRQAGVLTLTWRVAHTRNIVGFDLYAGTLRLNAHLIPVHRVQSYAFHTRWSGAGPYTLHLILSNGTSISLPIH